jgi:START domain-containing protein
MKKRLYGISTNYKFQEVIIVKKLSFILSCLLIIFFSTSIFAGDWGKPVKSGHGVKVYVKNIEGSKVKAFKGVTVVNAKIEVIGALLRDIPAGTKWMADVETAKMLKDNGNDSFLIYTVINPPVVSRRDLVTLSTTVKNLKKGVIVVNLKQIKGHLPKKSGIVRLPFFKGRFILKYLSRDKTLVTYEVQSDPGGNIPGWVVNMTSKDMPYKTLIGMKKMVKKQKYITEGANSKDKAIVDAYQKKVGK